MIRNARYSRSVFKTFSLTTAFTNTSQRVQLGVALTAAGAAHHFWYLCCVQGQILTLLLERMQAIPGPWPSLIREVQSIVLGDDGFGEDLDWGHDRGRDFQCLATIMCLIHGHPSQAFPGPARLEKWLSGTAAVPVQTRHDVFDTFRIFIALVKDKKLNVTFRKPRVSPIEFTMIGVLIFHFKKTHSMAQLASKISSMRADVREQFQDIRANNKVLKVMFAFLKKNPTPPDTKEGKRPVVAVDTIKKKGGVVKVKLEKRKMSPEPISSDDDDEAPPPRKKRASMPEASSSRAKSTPAASASATKAIKKEKGKSASTKASVRAPAISSLKTGSSVQTGKRTANATVVPVVDSPSVSAPPGPPPEKAVASEPAREQSAPAASMEVDEPPSRNDANGHSQWVFWFLSTLDLIKPSLE